MGCFGFFGVAMVCGWVHVTAIVCVIAAVPWLLWGEDWSVQKQTHTELHGTLRKG